MKRTLLLSLILLLLPCCVACGLSGANATPSYVGAAEDDPAPAMVAALATPAPTVAPRVLSYALSGMLFRRDGVLAGVTGVIYTEHHSVAVTVDVENRTAQPLALFARVPGCVNGWTLVFSIDGLAEGETSVIEPQSSKTLSLFATLDAGAADYMQIGDVQSLSLSFSGTLGEDAFAPPAGVVKNPACDAGYVQSYGENAPLLLQSGRARYYYHGLDRVTATLYVSAECLGEPFDMTVIPCVNGYALGANGLQTGFAGGATHSMLAVPLLDTVRAYAVSAFDTLSLSVVATQRGRIFGADTVCVPVGDEALAALASGEPVLPVSAPPAYAGPIRTFYRDDDIHIYYESKETEPSDYYGRITRYTLVCVNGTSATLYPQTELIKLAGAVMDGGFTGYIPPHAQARFTFYVCANVKDGAEIYLELQLLDGGARLRRVVSEPVTFTS